ncbi:uncharacterized protein LOC107869640 isoform X2 [Capsicum annuum]|uniref:uncharacterized protein LOC107869640 isoform X2 n=1 Tax=Capsicum annuum TaxID=4072 RepID=UPI0007BEE21F|nr:uncharacterized protein LOC107869640 isoform X2 [Capsicum annuum]
MDSLPPSLDPTPLMDYSPVVSPIASPEATPHLSPLHAIDKPKTLSEKELDAHRVQRLEPQSISRLQISTVNQRIRDSRPRASVDSRY